MKKLQILLPMLLMAICSFAQQKTITGTVTGNSDKAPLAGVTVQSKNKTSLTDNTGKFTIEASVGDNLTFTSVGFKSVTVKITSFEDLSVGLDAAAAKELEQVVVVGYLSLIHI